MEDKELIYEGIETAFIDFNYESNMAYRPQFISNNYKEGRKVIANIEEELLNCESFDISVAFITDGGVAPLLQTLKILEDRNVQGRILTTNYLNFSEPKALKKLAEFKNIEVKMYMIEQAGQAFHTKGYIFKKKDIYRMIIGSSNMTQKALSVNKEWNARMISTAQGEFAKEIMNEFEELWNSSYSLTYKEFIETYEQNYKKIKQQRALIDKSTKLQTENMKLEPNNMQLEFINNLEKICKKGENKALLISATGTGKTYASAFAIHKVAPKKVLFLVHREQIAKKSMESYQKVFGNTKKFGLLSGNSKECNADYLFSTMQMMAKPEIYKRYAKDEFGIIVIDEAHRIGATSYQKIMEYFTPQLLIGMTASPERTDGFNVYEKFDYNIAYEIRLQQALEEDLVCPFHYFGITDIEIEGNPINDETDLKNFRLLTCDERVNHIIEQIQYYGYSGERVNGLVFCSSKKEAQILSQKFNERGYSTIALTGDDSQEKREEAANRLVSKNTEKKLDYIFTVDIFNEGIDIPEINQVIMLRATQSPIVFVQQLGRGLRKSENKEYVVVLDFIGNYKNNFMIPIALSGDRSYNKDNIRRYLVVGEREIPGDSTLHFDEIAKKRIFEAIDNADFAEIRLIKENYQNLKNKIGRIPSLLDFEQYGEMDVLRIFDNPNLNSYYKFLRKYEKDYTIELSPKEEKIVEFISRKLANGKRVHELELLKIALEDNNNLLEKFKNRMKEQYDITIKHIEMNSVINVLTNEFPSGTGKDTYKESIFIEKNGQNEEYHRAESFGKLLENEDFYHIVKELIEFGINRYKKRYSKRYKDTNFVLYQKYTYEDVCKLLNWRKNGIANNIGGYKYDEETKTFPVFINYNKSETISDTIKYEDYFVSNNKLIAISKNRSKINSTDIQNFIKSEERGIAVELFVRKNKDDKISKEFYYLGKIYPTGKVKEFTMDKTDKTAVEIEWVLDTPVREDIYEYIVNE